MTTTLSMNTVDEAAGKLGLHPRTLRGIMQRNEIEYVRIGRRVMLTDRQLERFVRSNTVRARVDVSAPNPHYRPMRVVPSSGDAA